MKSAALGALAALLVALLTAGCATTEVPAQTFPAASIGPSTTVSPAVNQTRAALVAALATHQLVLTDTQAPVRPVESPLLATAPRAVYQVVLPKDPTRGFIVVYEFPDASAAVLAAAEEQHYLETGPGRIQSPEGSVQVLRQVGATLVFYDWLPGAAQDPAAPEIQQALETVGVGFPVGG
ncbi:MAG TPA: hypothetical protein VIU37_06675 [Candidatus Limnocylindrales bacterium]